MKANKNAIDLYTALHLIDVFDSDEEVVYIRKESDEPSYRPSIIITVKHVKESYDLRNTKVTNIQPYWSCYEYEGLLLTIAD